MMKRFAFSLVALLAFSTVQANAAIIFSEDFNAENGGVGQLNFTNFTQFTVANGTVDLIGNGFFDFLPGNGLYVDLDGSTNDAGELVTISFNLGVGIYTLFYDLAGSQRGTTETVEVSAFDNNVFIGSQTHTLASSDPFTTFSGILTVNVPSTFTFQFENISNDGDNVGALLDNVRLDDGQVVPAPAALLMVLSAAPVLAGRWMLRRKKN